MAIGAIILTIALIDELLTVLRAARPSFQAAEDAITLGQGGADGASSNSRSS